MQQNIILIDWFAASFPNSSVNDIINLLSLKGEISWLSTYGRYGYRDRTTFGNISILSNHYSPDTPGVMLEMSGQGCRTFETLSGIDFDVLFALCEDTENCKICRLDVAYDDKCDDKNGGLLDINQIIEDTKSLNWCSRWTKAHIEDDIDKRLIKKLERSPEDIHAYSVMFGRKCSEMYLRIYDKSMERGGLECHWVRVELVLKHERALQFILDSREIGYKMRGVISNYLNFVVPNDKCTNVTRLKVRKYWTNFLGEVEKIRLYTKKDSEYNLARVEKFVEKQAGNSIDVLIKCHGSSYIFDLIRRRTSRLSPLQKHLIENYRAEVGADHNAFSRSPGGALMSDTWKN